MAICAVAAAERRGWALLDYAQDGECYPPGMAAQQLYVDINAAASADPSNGRRHQ
jgi:hypothetical protein